MMNMKWFRKNTAEQQFSSLLNEVIQEASAIKQERSLRMLHCFEDNGFLTFELIEGNEYPKKNLETIRVLSSSEVRYRDNTYFISCTVELFDELIAPHLFPFDLYKEIGKKIAHAPKQYTYAKNAFELTFQQILAHLKIAKEHGYRVSDKALDDIFSVLERFDRACKEVDEKTDAIETDCNDLFNAQFEDTLKIEMHLLDRTM